MPAALGAAARAAAATAVRVRAARG